MVKGLFWSAGQNGFYPTTRMYFDQVYIVANLLFRSINLWLKDWACDRDGKNAKINFYEYFLKVNWLFKGESQIFMTFPSPQEICIVWFTIQIFYKTLTWKIWGYWIVIDWVFVGTIYYWRTDRQHDMTITHILN